ncbi:uncharacterized protein SCHCODRAFT_02629815 [Schizophyllum commune H4-8]|uniref:uncharacterized protein n=1 Tax=Schizophyllum commune (strain H4-8 / FGSC 9210) TaxID=578458 RepID=UPI0021609BBB|nr:uncharacterized protein SCHCODRAFT_02629815 [Schizophyllum commune H4-8]KAI5891693.1 hypothetical protein SCHCODRAFT_02629815 [Schizophyllum commune H4-8]
MTDSVATPSLTPVLPTPHPNTINAPHRTRARTTYAQKRARASVAGSPAARRT